MASSQTGEHDLLISQIMAASLGVTADDYTVTRNKVATNNLVFMIDLSKPTESENVPRTGKPLVSSILAGTSRLVLRIAKPDNNVEDSIRIRNEVATLTLARKALAQVDPLLVPRVYDWGDAREPGYILEEFKQGETMSWDDLKALNEQDLKSVCGQLAAVAKAFQSYQLPVDGYGGLTFDDDGNMSTTKVIFRVGGPFSTYRDYVRATLDWQLAQSEDVAALQGWRGTPGLRERIDAFVANELDPILDKIPESKPTLVHGDLTLPNILFELETKRLVAVVDFDFGHVGGTITELLYSFPEFQGIIPGMAEPEGDLRGHLLNGFADTTDAQFAAGKAWDEALAAQGAQRPCSIEGADEMSSVWWFAQDLMHFHWLLPRFIESQSPEQIQKWVEKPRKNIDTYLKHWGY